MTQELKHSKDSSIQLSHCIYLNAHRQRESENDESAEKSKTFLSSIIFLTPA